MELWEESEPQITVAIFGFLYDEQIQPQFILDYDFAKFNVRLYNAGLHLELPRLSFAAQKPLIEIKGRKVNMSSLTHEVCTVAEGLNLEDMQTAVISSTLQEFVAEVKR